MTIHVGICKVARLLNHTRWRPQSIARPAYAQRTRGEQRLRAAQARRASDGGHRSLFFTQLRCSIVRYVAQHRPKPEDQSPRSERRPLGVRKPVTSTQTSKPTFAAPHPDSTALLTSGAPTVDSSYLSSLLLRLVQPESRCKHGLLKRGGVWT
ncbi:hypothetical protein L226DRAFT_532785 [Lentinus tigrinus ALCF2SS1-7]|uniref:uncharacterized protein n=1 Tax=Lentinus tigrinus ALCF2SS1-7 TaxID=1328758 RepID=UPI00116604D8|nr:hypothetical protein L226DRAFT_532785 [Lentinus tigrinus ALCF2SS1-7]